MEKKSMEQIVEEIEDEIRFILILKSKNRIDMYDNKGEDETYQVYECNNVKMYYSPEYEYIEIVGLPFHLFKELNTKYGK